MKWFINPKTGKTVQYPDHFAELKPYLVEVDEEPVCESCIIPAELLKNDEDVDNDDDDEDVLN